MPCQYPEKSATYVRELFEDGVLKMDSGRNAIFASPSERLFLYGRWQDELSLQCAPSNDRDQFRRLEDQIHKFRATGKFTVPISWSVSLAADLDQISFAGGSVHKRSTHISRLLQDYCCRERLWRNN